MVKDRMLPFKILSASSLMVSLIVLAVVLSGVRMPSVQLPSAQISEFSTIGFVDVKPEAGVVNGMGVVSLAGGCYRVTANTDSLQAESIANGLEGKFSGRPNAHDMMKDTFDALGIDVLMVKVVDIQDDNYIGRMIVRQGDRIISVDSRPSDGIAVAVRTGSSIYFKESLMKERGEYIC